MTAATAPPGSAEPAALDRRQILVIFSGLLLAMLLAALDSPIVATALPTIVGELGGLERLAWVVATCSRRRSSRRCTGSWAIFTVGRWCCSPAW